LLPRGQNMQGAAEAISEMNASLFRGRKQKGIPDYRAIDVSAVACQTAYLVTILATIIVKTCST
jgi:hypothetical protein